MDIYDCKGRHHKVKMRFCNCEKRAATLLKHRLWPARPVSPNAAYHIDFLMLLSALTLECHVSVKGFTGTLKHLHSLSDSQARSDATERTSLSHLSKDGQQIAKRLRAQLEKSTKKIKNIVDAHNAQPFISNKINVHEAHSIKSSLYIAHEEVREALSAYSAHIFAIIQFDGPNSEDAPSMTQEAVPTEHTECATAISAG
ncbi:hypothetical protein CAPTEDRAFT_206553 [Capitella teleta]|uniref:CxC1-like cysteine cluster associated with KDZ transposases domain-containing protein n=1 Tax=Capitella teleta TaxID=283909 RepID=R7UZN8_CAPTE|nr:hypothetical protein CAPTEDRAFT_206553 [Capitella teleta]|eukprot:ELU11702.1 hypothetical protein CAPTEDRAFT_206553 [Capitella teleta]